MSAVNDTHVWVHGHNGKMGREILGLFDAGRNPDGLMLRGGSGSGTSGAELESGLGASDCVIDFSTVAGNEVLLQHLEQGSAKPASVILGTTGLSESVLGRWKVLAKKRAFRLLIAPNTSVGILMTLRAALSVAGLCSKQNFDIEIVETHHRGKKDAPSGTAAFLADQISESVGQPWTSGRQGERARDEIGVHAIRGGGVFGEHSVRLIGDFEEITISHRAFSRTLFASGSLILAVWLLKQPPGAYTILDVDDHP